MELGSGSCIEESGRADWACWRQQFPVCAPTGRHPASFSGCRPLGFALHSLPV